MCGLVGIFSSCMTMKHKEVLVNLLYLDTWRGRDATGVAAIRQNADTHIMKSTVPGYEFIEGEKLNHFLRFTDFCWIGHNRFGTVGKNIKSNAHPFMVLDEEDSCVLVGAHNGTLKNKHVLNDHLSFGTDSEALYNHIALTSLEETIPLVEGAWALTYYDHIAEELRFLRNKERPLFYAYEEGHKTLIWASEAWMIKIACSRAGVKIENDAVFTVEEDTLYKIPAPVKVNETLAVTKTGGLVGKTSAFFRGYQNQTFGRTAGQESVQQETTQTPQKTTSSSSKPEVTSAPAQSGTKRENVGGTLTIKKENSSSNQSQPDAHGNDNVTPISAGRIFKGFGGVPLSKSEIEKQLENGCSWCETEYISVKARFAWLDAYKPVCKKCLDGSHEDISLDSVKHLLN